MDTTESIEAALNTLQTAELNAQSQPALIRLAPDSDAYVLGNQEGFMKLAIAALKAAQGNNQSFEDEGWVHTEDWDWGLQGLRYDLNAHSYLRQPKTAAARVRDRFLLLLFAVIGIALLGATAVGIIEITTKIKHQF